MHSLICSMLECETCLQLRRRKAQIVISSPGVEQAEFSL
uniref:Uncharacterized protein n=1 Tax=Anguilla anguilla TaxID=7936 RepID=A0A0E9PKL4_ANGAN